MKKNKFGKLLSVFLATTLVAGSIPTIALAKDSGDDIPDEYKRGEYVATVETLEEAELMASVYGLELESYEYGIAVFKENEDLASVYSLAEIKAMDLPELCTNDIMTVFETNTTNTTGTSQYHHALLNTQDAWDTGDGLSGDGIKVAVIDTGILESHDEFEDVDFVYSYNTYHLLDKNADKTDATDDYGHGTHVAGIIAASAGGVVSGVAPDVSLINIKANIPGSMSLYISDVATGVNLAVENGADIINLSLGSSSPNSILETAVDDAIDAGVIVICAAGNDKFSAVSYPAAYDNTIAVSAVDSYLEVAYYTNIGTQIDVAAPGTSIYSTSHTDDDEYIRKSGTSMATPAVVGVAALLLQQDKTITPDEMKTLLTETAREAGDLGKDIYYGNGVVNAYGAVLGIDNDDMNLVTYDYNDGSDDTSTTYVADDVTLIEPTDPTGEYDFLGWSETQSINTDYFNFSTPINDNMTLYAQWDVEELVAPTAVVADVVTSNSVTLVSIDGAEYGVSSTTTAPEMWQDGVVFTGLTANTTYYFFARMKATTNQEASASVYVEVQTPQEALTFTGDMTDKAEPVYGDSWATVLPLASATYAAKTTDAETSIAGTYALAVYDADNHVVDTTDAPDAGTYTYEVLFTSSDSDSTYTNVVADSGSVTISPLVAEITWGSTSFGYTGQSFAPTASVSNLVDGDSVSVVVSGAATEVGTYTATAESLSGTDAGNYSLTAEQTQSFEITQGEGSVDVGDSDTTATYGDTITLSATISSAVMGNMEISSTDTETIVFTANKDTANEVVLGSVASMDVSGDVATISYNTRNDGLQVGTNEITVTYTGSNNLDETVETFNLYLYQKSISAATVTVASQTYTGSALTPTVTVKDGSTVTLVLNEDYTLEYRDNTEIGTATVTITGVGYYSESKSATFTISSSSDSSTSSSSGGGGGGGGGSSSGGSSVDTEGTVTTGTLKVSASTSGKTTTAGVEKDDMEDIVEDALDEVVDDGEAVVELDINTKSYTTKMLLTVTADALKSVATKEIVTLLITTDMGSMSLPKAIVEYLSDLADGDDITFVMELVDGTDVLSDAQQIAMGEVVAYDLSVYIGDVYVSEFDGEAIRVILPFEVAEGEKAEHIVVWHIAEDGIRTVIASTYYADQEEIGFNASHFSYYVVGYDEDSVLNEDVEEVEEEIVAILEEEVVDSDNPFTDVAETDFFYNSVLWAVANGITSGVTETTFGSYDTATRGQTVTLIWKAMGAPEPTLEENPFVDIAETDYFYKAVLWAVENGVASGTDVNTFSPNATVTRGQIVTFLWNNEGKPEVEVENPFVDVPSDMYYYNAVLWAVDENITSGTSADTFEPDALCNRGQIVTFLYRKLA